MRRAGRITADAISAVLAAVAPGGTTLDLDRVAEEYIRAEGAVPSFKGYRGFPATICASVNREIVHGIPSSERVLAEGDLLSLDFGAVWEGFHADSAVTVFVGGVAPSDAAESSAATERFGMPFFSRPNASLLGSRMMRTATPRWAALSSAWITSRSAR